MTNRMVFGGDTDNVSGGTGPDHDRPTVVGDHSTGNLTFWTMHPPDRTKIRSAWTTSSMVRSYRHTVAYRAPQVKA